MSIQEKYDLEILEPTSDYQDLIFLLHGISQGKENILLKVLSQKLLANGYGVVLFNFSYYKRGSEFDADEQASDLDEIYNYIQTRHSNKKFHLCGKSFGAVVGSKMLLKHPNEFYTMAVFGFIENFKGIRAFLSPNHKAFIVQGENDDFHKPQDVKRILQNNGVDFNLFEVKNAGHGLTDESKRFLGNESIDWYVTNLSKYL